MAEPEEPEDRWEKRGGKAKEVVQKHAKKYIERAQDQIDVLVEVVQEAEAETGDKAALFEKIFLQAHDICGLGSRFG